MICLLFNTCCGVNFQQSYNRLHHPCHVPLLMTVLLVIMMYIHTQTCQGFCVSSYSEYNSTDGVLYFTVRVKWTNEAGCYLCTVVHCVQHFVVKWTASDLWPWCDWSVTSGYVWSYKKLLHKEFCCCLKANKTSEALIQPSFISVTNT